MRESAEAARQQGDTADTTPTEARFVLPAGSFALAELFERDTNVEVTLAPATANPRDHALLVVRTDCDRSVVKEIIESDPVVEQIERFDGGASGWWWGNSTQHLIRGLVSEMAVVSSMIGRDRQWQLQLVFPAREAACNVHTLLREFDEGVECLRISLIDEMNLT